MEASPILAKIALAATYIQKAQVDKRGALSEKSLLLHGPHHSYVHVDYDAATGGIILAFAGHHRWQDWAHKFAHKRVTPEWAPDQEMKVNKRMTQLFDGFLHPEHDQLDLFKAMLYLSDGYLPRRVTCVGYATGGALATIGACWAASKLATADVRCISFASPRVGNSNFKVAFENLVGASYRVVLEADPAVRRPKAWFYKHVGHPVWFTEGTIKYQAASFNNADEEDHSLDKYMDALKHLVRQESSTTDKDEQGWAKRGSTDLDLRVQDGLNAATDLATDAMNDVADASKEQKRDGANRSGGGAALAENIDFSNLSGRGIDDFQVTPQKHAAAASGKARLNQIILGGKVAQATLLAQHAYEDAESFRKHTGMKNARFLDYAQDDTQAFVAWLDGGTAIFAFRGTESAKDVVVDLDARLQPVPVLSDAFPGAEGHVGFMRQFASITDSAHPERHIGSVLDELSGKQAPTRVLCCGHSLGGALATLGAAWSAFRWPDADVRCITLGSPRTGNPEFVHAVKYLVGGVHRLVYGWDPVPAVPPPGYFKHVKGRMFLYKDDAQFAKRPWYMSFGAFVKAGDHFTGPYISNISSIVGKELAAENLGLITQDDGDLEAAPAAQDKPDGKQQAQARETPDKAKKLKKAGSKGCGCMG